MWLKRYLIICSGLHFWRHRLKMKWNVVNSSLLWLIMGVVLTNQKREMFWINNKCYYYMCSSVSGQDESNPALWLATRAGKMKLSCPLGTSAMSHRKKIHESHDKSFIDEACSVRMAWFWPRSFFATLWTLDSVSVHKHAKKEIAQYQAILTEQAWSISRLTRLSLINHKGNYEEGVDAYDKFIIGNCWRDFLKAFLKAQVVHV